MYNTSTDDPEFDYKNYAYASEMVRFYIENKIDIVFAIASSNETRPNDPSYIPS